MTLVLHLIINSEVCGFYSFTFQSPKHGCENLHFAFSGYVHVNSLYAG